MFDFLNESFLDKVSPTRKKLYRAVLKLVELGRTAEIRDLVLRVLLEVVTKADRAGVFIDNSFWQLDRGDREPKPGTVPSGDTSSAMFMAPMERRGKRLGAVYLESSDPDTPLDAMECLIGSGIAQVAAGAFTISLYIERLEDDNARMRRELDRNHDLIGGSAAMAKVKAVIAKVGPTNSTVLIRGESGTGKEVVAHALHRISNHDNGPCLPINCAALPEHLLESELFGYEKGAFTGAVTQKKGLIEAASGGTVFLDEIGEISLAIQAKLLRVIEKKEVLRLGATRPILVDVRIVTATNRDLEEAVALKEFREDLYYRLKVVTIQIPPLRERREDIVPLARHFLDQCRHEAGRLIDGISPEAEDMLRNYEWPGNVRELQNVIKHGMVMGTSDMILPDDLGLDLIEGGGALPSFHQSVNEAKRNIIEAALQRNKGDVKKTARDLQLNLKYFYRLMSNLGMNAPEM